MARRKKTGRPTKYTPELTTRICKRLAEGESLRSICRDPRMPCLSTVLYWLNDGQHEAFLEQYKVARDIQADLMVEDIIEIADDSSLDYTTVERDDGSYKTVIDREHVQRSRLRVDARKWTASKLKPRKYGDKVDVTSGGEPIKGNEIVFVNFKEDDQQRA